MAASIKALNARIRQNKALDYFCSTHFWGPASNFGIPIAAVMDTQKDPEFISGTMTTALLGYSSVFMRYAFAVTPKNYLLFGCHAINFGAQATQAYRYINHWHLGGKAQADKAKEEAEAAANTLSAKGSQVMESAKQGLQKAEGQVKAGIDKVKGQ